MKNGKIMIKLKRFRECKKGATAVEYGLLAAGISLAIVVAVFAFGDDLEDLVQWMIDALPV